MLPQRTTGSRTPLRHFDVRAALAFVYAVAFCVLIAAAVPAPAAAIGRAASGELLFYPCTTCHPVSMGADGTPDRALPNGFEGHQIVLVGHDQLGDGSEACLVCHDDPARDPSKLKVGGGDFVDAGGDVSRVCFTCHSGTYREWKAGIHGRNQPTCTSPGCHDPHSPAWIYGDPLLPFLGTGFQVRAVSGRQPFTPLAAYPVKPPVYTPSWLVIAAALGAVASTGLVGFMVRGRAAR